MKANSELSKLKISASLNKHPIPKKETVLSPNGRAVPLRKKKSLLTSIPWLTKSDSKGNLPYLLVNPRFIFYFLCGLGDKDGKKASEPKSPVHSVYSKRFYLFNTIRI